MAPLKKSDAEFLPSKDQAEQNASKAAGAAAEKSIAERKAREDPAQSSRKEINDGFDAQPTAGHSRDDGDEHER